MLRWMAAVMLVLAIAGTAVASPSSSAASAGAASRVLPGHSDDDHDDDDECDNSGPGNCEDRGRDDDDDDDLVPVVGEIPTGSLVIEILDDDAFTPSTLTIDPGQSVTFVNRHDDVHSATGSGFDTGDIPPGGTATVVFDEPGTFGFACRYHPEMTGSIGVRGPDGTVPPPAQSGPPPEGAETVEIANFAFSPPTLTVAVGTTVAWTNADSAPHTATAEDGSFDSDILDPGASFSFTFDEPGTFAYRCALHPEMQGTVTVAAGEGGDPAPATEEAAGEDGGGDESVGEADDGQAAPLTVRLHAGTCRELGEAVADLEPASVATDQTGASAGIIPVAVSVTTVDEPLAELTGGDRVVVVALEDGTAVACGALGGPAVAGEVIVGLGELDGSGYEGVAVLREERTGTVIAVYVTGGGAPDAPADAGTDPDVAPAAVTIADFAFDPPSLEVPVGTTVTWTNQDEAPHTATAEDGSFDTGRLDGGQNASHRFDQPGTFAYACDFHPDMTGTIVVVPSADA